MLREKVISLEHELEHRPKREALEDLGEVKDKLEAKLAELGGLVFELGRAQKSAIVTSASSRRQSRGKSPKRSPDQRIWRNALTLSEVTGGQDRRLPPIVEDKYYPRRTLEYDTVCLTLQAWLMIDSSEELLGILNVQGDSADSPDLGPPPIAHFDDGDPVKQDGGYEVSLESNSSDLGSSLAFTNLETRRKRKETTFSKEAAADTTSSIPTSLEDTSTPIGTISSQPLKLGAKRKLSVRDDEEHNHASATAVKDDFRFNRRAEVSNKPIRDEVSGGGLVICKKAPQDPTSARGDTNERTREISTKSTSGRKALEESKRSTIVVVTFC